MTGIFAAGEKALLLDSKKRRYLIDLADDGEFHSHNGFVAHSQIIGNHEGLFVNSTKGSEYIVIRPTLEDFVVEIVGACFDHKCDVSHVARPQLVP